MLATDDLYPAELRTRAAAPLFAGRPLREDAVGHGNNPMCGDRVRVALRAENAHLAEVRHETRGCAVCLAAADIMAEAVTGLTMADASGLAEIFLAVVETGQSGDAPSQFALFRPLAQHRARRRCATLPWSALTEALGPRREHDA